MLLGRRKRQRSEGKEGKEKAEESEVRIILKKGRRECKNKGLKREKRKSYSKTGFNFKKIERKKLRSVDTGVVGRGERHVIDLVC